MTFDVLVIGGGLNGLASLNHLRRLGVRRLGLIERFRLGHDRGSSHGQARITRSTYASPLYARLMHLLHEEEWPRLEREAGERLVHPCPGCFFGPPGEALEKYKRAVLQAQARVEWLTPAEGRRRFPQFRFEDAEGILLDHTAGVVAADDAIAALIRLARGGGAQIMEETEVLSIDASRQPLEVATERGVFRAERLIVTAGAWVGRLLPFLRPRLKAARQTVGYFEPAGARADYGIGRFPVWLYIADGENGHYYGMPEFGRPGIKAARHLAQGIDDNPDAAPAHPDPARIEELWGFLRAQLAAVPRRLLAWEHCLYTNTETEDFILDLHPGNPLVAVGAGFSGHGFKFGPFTGRVLAELVLHGKTSIPEFEEARGEFSIHRPR
ncbi:MAG: N-methyl-L-tryptophan oxidase [Candidatus Tectomicrobia bacterium]|uniref:N-methyl-L-tryptophan oxidase n=1 Tax=Tectimicrobiota bacterium TaxID=2528274 RepID=A0A932HXJ1_UNCTE|nr:N-methyl-L-tryptophan oxidase [Candidatus Tectomicrobia bacterium]